jgi:hypothetical protein
MLGSDGVPLEVGRVVVAFVQGMSDDRPPVVSDPFAQNRGLAEAGWGGDEGQFPAQARVQPLDQAGAVAGFLLLVINGIPLGSTHAVTVVLHIETLNMPD